MSQLIPNIPSWSVLPSLGAGRGQGTSRDTAEARLSTDSLAGLSLGLLAGFRSINDLLILMALGAARG